MSSLTPHKVSSREIKPSNFEVAMFGLARICFSARTLLGVLNKTHGISIIMVPRALYSRTHFLLHPQRSATLAPTFPLTQYDT